MSQVMKQLKDGRWVVANDDIIRDGERVRIGMPFMDGKTKAGDSHIDASHQRPRQAQMSSMDSVAPAVARAKMIERQQNAWKDSKPLPTAKELAASREPFYPQQPSQQPVAHNVRAGDESPAYRAYKRRLEDGYKTRLSSAPGRI